MPLRRGSKVCSTCSIMRPSRLRSRDESQLSEVTSGSPKLYRDCSSSWYSPFTASGVRPEFNSHSRSRRSETFNCRTDWARVSAFSELVVGSRSISLSSTDCVTVCSGSHRAISFLLHRSLTAQCGIRLRLVHPSEARTLLPARHHCLRGLCVNL